MGGPIEYRSIVGLCVLVLNGYLWKVQRLKGIWLQALEPEQP